MLRYIFFAFIREVECELFGHVPSTNRGNITYSPLVVMNQYPDGTTEKIADFGKATEVLRSVTAIIR